MELKDLSGLCADCAKLPHPDRKTVLDGCPIKKRSDGKFHLEDFDNKDDCDSFVDVAEIESPAQKDTFIQACFLNRENQCYEGCSLYGTEDCKIVELIDSLMQKLDLESSKIELEIAILTVNAEKMGIKLPEETIPEETIIGE